ncbi:hypothetical protein ACFL2O_02860 [Thermodesulfobacteriota bacterium]
MIITINNGKAFDTNKDLTAPERHILQKLIAWEGMADTIEQFREKKWEAYAKGWNNSGPIKPGKILSAIVSHMELKVKKRLSK